MKRIVVICFLLICFGVTAYSINYDNDKNIPTKYGCQKSFPSLTPSDHENLEYEKANGNFRLDSVYEDLNSEIGNLKRKWYYHYDNNKLSSSEYIYFLSSFDRPMNTIEEWQYGSDGLVVEYVKKEKIISSLDSLFITSFEKNNYKDGLLVSKYAKQVSGYSNSTHGGYNVDYIENNYQYQYNENKLLVKEYLEGNSDTTFYQYDSQDRLLTQLRIYPLYNYMTFLQYTYQETDTSKFDTKKYVTYNNTCNPKTIDTITTFNYEYSFDYSFDDQNRIASLITNGTFWVDGSCNIFKTYYEYSPSGKKKFVTIYFDEGIIGQELKCYEKARIEYTYDENDNLKEYRMTYFDELLYKWLPQETKTYFYSSTGEPAANREMEQMSLKIYPNPASDFISVKLSEYDNSNYCIYNLFGETIKEGQVENHSISIADLKKGSYFIRVNRGATPLLGRFVKN
jgi:hypothetical protein